MTTDNQVEIINLEDYVLTGGGRWGESFNHRDNPEIMMKLYAPEQKQMAMDEYERARKVFELGIATPEPGRLIQSPDGRMGVIFRRIPDKKSFARAVGENPDKIEEYVVRFTSMCKELHATKVPKGTFSSAKENYYRNIKDFPSLTSKDKDTMIHFLEGVPDADTALHGDLHFGNVIFSGDKAWFIDLGEFTYGYPLFDFGMAMIVMTMLSEYYTKEMFHMDKATARQFWYCFIREYFGKDRPVEDIERELMPFVALRALGIESLEKKIIPIFHRIVEEALSKGLFL